MLDGSTLEWHYNSHKSETGRRRGRDRGRKRAAREEREWRFSAGAADRPGRGHSQREGYSEEAAAHDYTLEDRR